MEMKIFRRELRLSNVPESMLKWLNLAGRPSPNNPKGARSFELELPEKEALDLADLGWRVKKRGYDKNLDKFANSSDMNADLDNATYKMKITVNYDSKNPPKIYRVVDGENKRRLLKPDAEDPDRDVAKIDNDSILYCDLILNGWVSNRDGIISPFLNVAYFVVESNEILDKWASFDVDDEDNGDLPWSSEE